MAPAPQQEASRKLNVVESAVVAPWPIPPVPETSLPLTFFDVFWLNFPPVERVFFYHLVPGPGAATTATILSNLKTSLAQALRAFYPLAGRLRLRPGTTDRHELHYQPGDGVTFTVAMYDLDVDELALDEPREVAKIAQLVPPLPDGGAVLALQATVLRGGRGLSVGMALHHAACDGACSTHFLHTWAAASAGAVAPAPPVIDRTLVKDPSGLCDAFIRAMASTEKKDYVKMPGDKLLATFTLSIEDIQRIKDVVLLAAAGKAGAPPRCSSLVATFGFIWSCHQRAKDDKASNGGGGDPTYFIFPVDHRSRMEPAPIPDEYLGNCVGAALQGAPKDRLAMPGAVGLVTACTAVAAAIEQAVGVGSIRSPELWWERIREAILSGGGVLTVAGSPKFRVYDVDFGFGQPAKVEIVSVARTGALAVAESRRSSGGIEVGISLPADAMRRFQCCFHDAIAWLQCTTPSSGRLMHTSMPMGARDGVDWSLE
uniref:Anthocyanin 5-aromatic acyltransferase n=2 Tax=Aegilops tauschii subsp. strangulata TaxID=200361 RepID=A0A453ISW2_AEGTS